MGIVKILFSFRGRTNRKTYWLFSNLPGCLVCLGWWIGLERHGIPWLMIFVGFLLAMSSALAMQVKRCHDRDHSGWYVLAAFVPFYQFWYTFELFFLPGSGGPNRYGFPPGQVERTPAARAGVPRWSCLICGTDNIASVPSCGECGFKNQIS